MRVKLIFFTFALLINNSFCQNDSTSVEKPLETPSKPWISYLSKDSPVSRATGAFKLGEMGSEADYAIPMLEQLLVDNSDRLNWKTITQTQLSIPGVYTTVGREAAIALTKIGEQGLVALIESANKNSGRVRLNMFEAFNHIPYKAYKNKETKTHSYVKHVVDQALPALYDESLVIRSGAGKAIIRLLEKNQLKSKWGDLTTTMDKIFDSLLLVLNSHESDYVRANAATALGKMSLERYQLRLFDIFMNIFETDVSEVKAATCEFFGRVGDCRANDLLVGAIADSGSDGKVRKAAFDSFSKMYEYFPGSPKHSSLKDRWVEWWNNNKDSPEIRERCKKRSLLRYKTQKVLKVGQPSIMANIPLPEGAEEKKSYRPGQKRYKVFALKTELIEFYDREMPKNGWTKRVLSSPNNYGYKIEWVKDNWVMGMELGKDSIVIESI